MSCHWEKHQYEGGNGNDSIFTWYGKDTLIGGKGNDHLYADGDDCTMIGGKGKDYFYLDRDSTSLIKDYRDKGKDIIRIDGYNKKQIKITKSGGNSLIKAGNHILANVEGIGNLKKGQLEYSGSKTKVKNSEHNHMNYRTIDVIEADLTTQIAPRGRSLIFQILPWWQTALLLCLPPRRISLSRFASQQPACLLHLFIDQNIMIKHHS